MKLTSQYHQCIRILALEKKSTAKIYVSDELCDHVEQLNASSAEDLARLEPLLEFTLPHRDLRYDEALQQYACSY